MIATLLLLALAGCGDPKAVDADADGTAAGTDCDDADPAVNPRAAEACNGVDDNCDGAIDEGLPLSDWLPDGDADGYGEGEAVSACAAPAGTSPTGGDCDDADPTSFPGAPERCDGVDHDCDGLVNEPSSTDATAGYRDADGDGYGDDALTACAGTASVVTEGGDCDDADPEVSPAGVEACTPAGRDEDCDGLLDDADPSLGVGSAWWPDADGDGFGAGEPQIACSQPPDMAPIAGDCEDTDAAVHPGAAEPDCAGALDSNCDGTANDLDRDGDGSGACTDCDDTDDHVAPDAPEVCNDLDDDCNGAVDDGLATSPYYADTDGDGYGDPDVRADRCGPNVDWVASAGDCNDTVSTTNPGADERCSSIGDEDCDGEVNEEGASDCHEWARDADGDGYGDPDDIRCLCGADGDYSDSVSSYSWIGDCDDADGARTPQVADACGDDFDANCDGLDGCVVSDLPMVGHGAVSRAFWGQSALGADLTGDGTPDLGVGVPGQYGDPGAVEVYAGPLTFPLGAPTFTYGPDGDDGLGTSVRALDADADGALDLVATAPYRDGGYVSEGAMFLLHGPLTADGTLAAMADLTIEGGAISTVLGVAAGGSSDLDGDGNADLVVSSDYYGSNGQGAVWVLPAAWTGTYAAADLPVIITGVQPYESAGMALDVGSDVDGDGAEDLLIGSLYGGYVFFGPLSGSMTVADAEVTVHDREVANYTPFRFTPDLDDDGLDDLLVTGTDGVYLHTGLATGRRPTWSAWGLITGIEDYMESPSDVAVADVDGDGVVDLVAGTGEANVNYGHYGAAYVLRGPVSSGTHPLEEGADAGWVGDSSTGYLGKQILPVGDLDGVAGEEMLLWGWSGTGAAGYAGAAWYLSASALP